MSKTNPELPPGYSDVGQGHIANVVTCLEMTARPPLQTPRGFAPPYELVPFTGGIAQYRTLFRRIGADWMWVSRLFIPDEKLSSILANPLVEVFVLQKDGDGIGLLELDFRAAGECELVFFGLAPEAIGSGLGGALMDQALVRAWARPIRRLWVHTCTFDHPAALPFYIRSGFKPYAIQVDVHPDPRLTGHLPRHVAPHIALIEP